MWCSIAVLVAVWQVSAADYPVNQCFNGDAPGIPRNHLYHRKCKPVVMGHRGNPLKFQENSMDGFKSVAKDGGDGFEFDVFLTADNRLVCFHDEDTERLTGVPGNIQAKTAADIDQLSYKTSIQYGSQTYNYDKRRKLVYLEDVLQEFKNTNMLLYIELKPSSIIVPGALAYNRSVETGIRAGKMVQHFRMEKRVVFISYDTIKMAAVKSVDDDLVVGISWVGAYWQQSPFVFALLKNQFKTTLPGLGTCIDPISTADNSFVSFFFKSGSIEKSVRAGFTDLQYDMFNDPLYGGTTETIKMINDNYGKKIVIGAYTFYDMHLTANQIGQLEDRYKSLIKQGVEMIITDDIESLRCLASRTSRKFKCCIRRKCRRGRGHGGDRRQGYCDFSRCS